MKLKKIYFISLISVSVLFCSSALAQQAGNFNAITDADNFETNAGTLNLIYDTDEDANGNGQLDLGEDVDGDNTLDTAAGLRLEARNPDGTAATSLDINAESLTHNGVAVANADDISDLQNAVTNINGNLNTEAFDRVNQDDAIEAGVGLNADGSYTANAGMTYIDDATSVVDATEQLDQALYEESQARISADNALRASIDQNQSDIEENRKGIAMVAAMTHTTLLPGNDKALDIGVGYFRSESAYSINYAGRLNENVQLNFSAASTSAFKDSAVKCSLGFQW